MDEFGNGGLLVVSNTAGAAGEHEQVYLFHDIYLKSGYDIREKARCTCPPPLYKGTASQPPSLPKKPGCRDEVVDYFLNQTPPRITNPDQIVVIGDRLLTDVILGSFIGGWTIWLQHGVIRKNDAVSFPFLTLHAMDITNLPKIANSTRKHHL